MARLLAPARQPLSSLMNERSSRRTFAVLDLELDALRKAAQVSSATLNDAFVASSCTRSRLATTHHTASPSMVFGY